MAGSELMTLSQGVTTTILAIKALWGECSSVCDLQREDSSDEGSSSTQSCDRGVLK